MGRETASAIDIEEYGSDIGIGSIGSHSFRPVAPLDVLSGVFGTPIAGYQTHESRTLHARHKRHLYGNRPFSVTFAVQARYGVTRHQFWRGNPMTAATQPATPAAPNNNEPVREPHPRNVIPSPSWSWRLSPWRVLRLPRVCRCQRVVRQGQQGQPGQDRRGRRSNPGMGQVRPGRREGRHLRRHRRLQDYTSENPALDSGELDLNEFQHLLYLANYNVSNKKDLQPIGGTAIYPLGVYSTKVKDIKDLKQGDTVTIPNDETNQARAIGVPQAAGPSRDAQGEAGPPSPPRPTSTKPRARSRSPRSRPNRWPPP